MAPLCAYIIYYYTKRETALLCVRVIAVTCIRGGCVLISAVLILAMAIPTLDLRLAESDRREAARQLVVALEDPGFLYLQNVKGYQPGETASVVAITIPSNRAAARSPRIDEYNTDHCFYSTQNLYTCNVHMHIPSTQAHVGSMAISYRLFMFSSRSQPPHVQKRGLVYACIYVCIEAFLGPI